MEEKKEETMPESNSSMPAEKKSGMKGMLVALVALVALGGVAFGLYQWSGNAGTASMTTEERNTAVAKKLGEVNSVAFSGKVDVELGKTSIEQMKSTLSVLGVSDPVSHVVVSADGMSGMKDDKSQASLNVKVMLNDDAGQEKMSLGLNTMMLDTLTYLQLQKLPESLKTTIKDQAGLDVAFLEEQWIEMNVDDLVQQLGLPEESVKELKSAQLSEADKDAMTTAFVNNTFLKLQGDPTEEEVRGEKTLKYEMMFDVGTMKSFLEEVKPVLIAKGTTEEEFNTMLQDFEKEYNEMFAEVNMEMHAWVGKKDNNLYKMEMIFSPVDQKDVEEIVDMTVTMEFFDHGKEVNLEKPAEVMSIQEVIGQFAFAAAGSQIEEPAAPAQE